MNDQVNVSVGARRPEMGIPCLVEFAKLQALASRVQLQIESRGFSGLLLLACQVGQIGSEGVGMQNRILSISHYHCIAKLP